jgi:hypothetical protein
MKKNTLPAVLVCLVVAAGLSCKSSPPQTEPPEPPAAPQAADTGQSALDALNTAVADAEQARQRALDFEGPGYFPSNWEEAEAQYAAAAELPRGDEEELRRAAESYTALAASYNALFAKTIPLYAQAREDEIIAARDALTATGLAGTFPEYLRGADDIALAALGQYEAGDYYAAKDTAAAALNEYQGLKNGAEAYLARQEILKRHFVMYDPESFDRAEETGLSALEDYEGGNRAAALDKAEEARLRYTLVLANGWAAFALSQRQAAGAERQRALDAKANVAVRDTFNQGEDLFVRAVDLMKAENYEQAANLFNVSIGGFRAAADAAEEKRRIAEEVITEAEEKIEESGEAARQAELIIEGGSL